MLAGSHVPSQFTGVRRCKWAKCRWAPWIIHILVQAIFCLESYMFPLQTAVWGRSGGVQAYKGHPSQTSPDSEAVGSFPWQPSARGQCQCQLLFLGDQADNGKHGEEGGRELGHRRQEDESGKLTFFVQGIWDSSRLLRLFFENYEKVKVINWW